jgi:hypothetical protein
MTSFEKLQKSRAEWRRLLPPNAYEVLVEEDTERPFTSPLHEEKSNGTYVCAACFLPLFESSAKYDSGTGWPSFFSPIEGPRTGSSAIAAGSIEARSSITTRNSAGSRRARRKRSIGGSASRSSRISSLQLRSIPPGVARDNQRQPMMEGEEQEPGTEHVNLRANSQNGLRKGLIERRFPVAP